MVKHSRWLKLIWRLCALAILCGTVGYLWGDTKVVADMNTTCSACDSNNVTGQSNCGGSRDSCLNACQQGDTVCQNNCWNSYYTCSNNTWNTYDNCLYGFLDNSGLCAITNQQGTPPPPGRGRTPCDFACRDQMLDCRQNDGTTCGEDYNACVLSCG
jgi:hypothetical protein